MPRSAPSAPPAPSAPSRVERRRSTAREEFVAAARGVVDAHGFHGFSLEQVARRVGVTKQAVYHYFDSKESMLVEVAIEAMTRVAHDVARAVAATAGAADAVEALIRTYFDAYRGRRAMFQLCHTVMPTLYPTRVPEPAQLARVHALNDLLLGGVAERVARERGGGADDARRFAFVAYTSTIGLLAMKALVETAGDPLRHADAPLLDTLVTAFRNDAPRFR